MTVKKNLSDTKVQLKLVADAELQGSVKQETLRTLAREVKVQGFRPGKAPLHLIEKQLNPQMLQTEFLQRALDRLYATAIKEHKLRVVSEPQVKITKFVPFDALEIEAEVEIIGDVTLPDYKKMKLARPEIKINAKEVDEVIKQLTIREAEKKDVDRAAKDGDQVWIDFTGVDANTKEAIKGADGKDYPLQLGSNSFIPGFETNLVGVKPGEEKTFTLTFPKDYGVKALQNRKITFTVTVKKVQELVEPKMDDELVKKVGPFKTVIELKEDIKKQLTAEKLHQAEQKFADELLMKITEKTKVALPEILINEQIERLEREERQNLMYRGQTWQEFLDSEKLTEEKFRATLKPKAELRVKAGLVLSEVAELEKITITPAEFDAQLKGLKARYTDANMQAELEKPENRRDVLSRMLTDKTVAKLKEYATA